MENLDFRLKCEPRLQRQGGTKVVLDKKVLISYPILVAAIFTKTCQYAIQAVLYLARATNLGESVHVKQISDALEIPHHFLGKVLQQLSRHGIVTSQKGMKGGFHLARPSQEITIIDVVNAIDGHASFRECIFGFPGCGDPHPCSMHEMWKGPKESILEMLRRRSIADLSIEMDGKLKLTSSPNPHLTPLQQSPSDHR